MVTKLQKKVEDLDRALKQKNDELEVSSLHNLYNLIVNEIEFIC